MRTPRLTPELIAAAVEGYEIQKTRIDAKIAERIRRHAGSAEAQTEKDECRWQEGDCRSTTQEMGRSQEGD